MSYVTFLAWMENIQFAVGQLFSVVLGGGIKRVCSKALEKRFPFFNLLAFVFETTNWLIRNGTDDLLLILQQQQTFSLSPSNELHLELFPRPLMCAARALKTLTYHLSYQLTASSPTSHSFIQSVRQRMFIWSQRIFIQIFEQQSASALRVLI